MATDNHIIVGVHITNRIQKATEVQKVFTDYGATIKTRLGLNDVHSGKVSPSGLILLEMIGDEAIVDEMIAKLTAIVGVDAKKIVFDHP